MRGAKTKAAFAEAFAELAEELPVSKITVSNIIERSGKSRKAFYYNFQDKLQLVIWILRRDLGLALISNLDENVLVYESADSPTSEFPYYVFRKSGVRSLDHASFFNCLWGVLCGNREYYLKVFDSFQGMPEDLSNYLFALYYPELKRDILHMLGGREMGSNAVDKLARLTTGAFVDYFVRGIRSLKDPSASIPTLDNTIHELLFLSLEQSKSGRFPLR